MRSPGQATDGAVICGGLGLKLTGGTAILGAAVTLAFRSALSGIYARGRPREKGWRAPRQSRNQHQSGPSSSTRTRPPRSKLEGRVAPMHLPRRRLPRCPPARVWPNRIEPGARPIPRAKATPGLVLIATVPWISIGFLGGRSSPGEADPVLTTTRSWPPHSADISSHRLRGAEEQAGYRANRSGACRRTEARSTTYVGSRVRRR